MSSPVTVSGSMNFPPDTGVPNTPIPIAFSAQFDSTATDVLSLTGAGTKALDLGTITAGAKAVLIKVDPSTTSFPINIRFNTGSSSGQVEVSPGGLLFVGSPNPTSGITAIALVYTNDVKVRVWVLG